jgi:hypothetical protein
MILEEKALFVCPLTADRGLNREDVWRGFLGLSESQKEQFHLLRNNASTPFKSPLETFLQNCSGVEMEDGMFIMSSRFNHSCIANAVFRTPTADTVTMLAAKNIAPGEEITFDYDHPFNYMEARDRRERHEAHRFACDCKACRPGTQFQQASEMRRRLIRGLL